MRRLVPLLLAALAAGCPAEEEPPAKSSGGPPAEKTAPAEDPGAGDPAAETQYDLSHVSAGQVYRYQGPGDLRSEYRVLEVGPDRVRYEMVTLMPSGEEWLPLGDPQEESWPGAGDQGDLPESLGLGELDPEQVQVSEGDPYELEGVTFETQVIQVEVPTGPDAKQVSRTWAARRGGRRTFPDLLKNTLDGEVNMELISVSDG